jgi:cellulose biosynthesis protein BcsQ
MVTTGADMTAQTLVVGGFDELAAALEATGHFAQVHRVASTGGLRDGIQSGKLKLPKSEVTFLFADNLTVDTEQDLGLLVNKLSSWGYRVIIVAASLHSQTLVEQNPSAGLLTAPHSVNKTLAGISALIGQILPPDPNGHADLGLPGAAAATSSPADSWSSPSAGFSAPAAPADAPAAAPAPNPAGFISPAPAPAAVPDTSGGLSSWGAPASTPAPATSGGLSGWETPAAAAPAPSIPARAGADTWSNPMSMYSNGPANETGPTRRGMVIVICSPKGGVGKSTLSLNLAAFFALRLQGSGRNVVVVDANTQQADTGKYVGNYSPNIVTLNKSGANVTPERIAENLLHLGRYNLDVLLGPAQKKDASPAHINGALYRTVVEQLRSMYDYIIIDTPVAELYHNIFQDLVLPTADYLCVCVAPNNATLVNAHQWLGEITNPRAAGGYDFDANKIGILLNRAEDDIGFTESDVREALGTYRFLSAIPETKEWKKSINEGRLIAPENYAELSAPMAQALSAITNDPVLEDAIAVPAPKRAGLFARILGKG